MEAKKTTVLTDNGILTRPQIREELRWTDETLTKLEKTRGFPCRREGHLILYDVDAIKKWISKRRG